jgi:hypothetical protein
MFAQTGGRTRPCSPRQAGLRQSAALLKHIMQRKAHLCLCESANVRVWPGKSRAGAAAHYELPNTFRFASFEYVDSTVEINFFMCLRSMIWPANPYAFQSRRAGTNRSLYVACCVGLRIQVYMRRPECMCECGIKRACVYA